MSSYQDLEDEPARRITAPRCVTRRGPDAAWGRSRHLSHPGPSMRQSVGWKGNPPTSRLAGRGFSLATNIELPTTKAVGALLEHPAAKSVKPFLAEEGTMKTMTCKELGGPCDAAHHGATADDVIKAQDKHLKEVVAGGDRKP